MRKLYWFALLFISINLSAQNDPEQKLKELQIVLPEMSVPVANYVKFVQSGKLLFLSGHGPRNAKGELITGRVGENLDIQQGYDAAKACAIDLIATLKAATGGDLRKVKRIVRVFGLVNSTNSFTDQPKVLNGCSDLLVGVFGEKGRHVRTAVGANVLPNNIAVEVELIAEIE